MHRPDTDETTQAVYDQKIRELSPEKRFLRGVSLTHFSRQMCLAGIQRRNPSIGAGELRVKMFETIYGEAFSEEEKQKIRAYFLV